MKWIYIILYIAGFIITYVAYRKNRIKVKEWTWSTFILALILSALNPLFLSVYAFIKLVTWDFWDRDLPKWM